MELRRLPTCSVPDCAKIARAHPQVIPLDLRLHHKLPDGPHALCKDHAPNACFCPTCAQKPKRLWQVQTVQGMNVSKASEYGYDTATWVNSSSYLGKPFWCQAMRQPKHPRTHDIEGTTLKEEYKCPIDGCRCASTPHGPHRLIFDPIFQVFGGKKGFEQ